MFCLQAGAAMAQAAAGHEFDTAVAALPTASYLEKEELAGRIARSAHPQALTLLRGWLDGKLHADAAGHAYLEGEGGYTDALSGAAATPASPDELEKIGTNNRLRKALKGLLAQFGLASAEPGMRIEAVREMRRELDESAVAALQARLPQETDAAVKHEIELALALAGLASEEPAQRLAAIASLDGDRSTEVYNRLSRMASGDEADADAAVRNAAGAAVRSIDSWRSFYQGVETLFFGLSLGSVLVLAAIGLAITFGVMGVINMAHGELIMLGAYTAYVMQLLMPQNTGLALLLSIPAAFLVSGAFGVAIERVIVRHLYGRPLETLLATFGLSLVLQQLVRSIFSANNRPVAIPEFMSGVWQINDVFSITYNRLYILIFALMVFALLLGVLKRTSLGLKVRAVSQNRGMAKAMGVRTDWVDAATFGLGAGIAGIAGVALSQLTNVGPNLGQAYIIDSFMVVVFGGVGNLWGTLIGGMALGVVNKLLEPYAGAVLAKILVLVALILFIQRKPRGLFPQKGRAAEGH
ncbi:urea ABC transporter permease subunit UrtB [Solimonas fluminis]|uniref:Urea ABC transporter permease subunit UrtB n=1 Tax=Solimonas fluminis TaxID=2086571 RepID=A0A2S5TK45_9GAMM|nr:urea ABC transporter permease subunit UrtB [Solimonas fluminis]PPE75331.1 urea ABC transporter permease subunit UrtB [Solimonas fluminis]